MLKYFKQASQSRTQSRTQSRAPKKPQANTSKLKSTDISKVLAKAMGKEYNIYKLSTYAYALTHKSWYISATEAASAIDTKDIHGLFQDTYKDNITSKTFERPEFLGDSILGMVVTEYIYNMFPSSNEGFMTRLKSRLVNKDACIKYSRALGLDKLLRASATVKADAQTDEDSRILEDIFEAFVAAVYTDFNEAVQGIGFYRCQQFIHGVLNVVYGGINGITELSRTHENYKDTILQAYQQAGWPQPCYYGCHENPGKLPGPGGRGYIFWQCVYMPDDPLSGGFKNPTHLDSKHPEYLKQVHDWYVSHGLSRYAACGGNKKKAQQEASALAIKALNEYKKVAGLYFRPTTFVFNSGI